MTQAAQDLNGRTVIDRDGSKVGKVEQVYLNDQGGQPEWVTVSTGLFGNKESFVPLRGSSFNGEDIVVQVSKDIVKDAPRVDNDGHLEPADEQELYTYYADKMEIGFGVERAGETETAGSAGRGVADLGDDEAMTRSEERLHVGTEQVEAGRARLRKYIVTENVTQTIPVSHEEVRLEREPITEANHGDATSGSPISEAEHEITLHAERPVVAKETVPVERVKLTTETVTEDQQVDETVRKERIDYDEAAAPAAPEGNR